MVRLDLACRCQSPAGELWPRLLEAEQAPPRLPALRSARVVSEDGPERVVEWVVLLRGSALRWSQRERIDHQGMSVGMSLCGGDLRYLGGSWTVRPQGLHSEVALALEMDFGFPRIAAVVDAVLTETLTEIARGIVRQAEGGSR